MVAFRPVDEGDSEFLYRVYASTREDVNLSDWSRQQKEEFLRMQFRAQHNHYRQRFPEAEYSVVLLGEQSIGCLYVDRGPDEIRILDIALLAEHRGGGIGSQIVQALLNEAITVGKPVRIHVLRGNAALHLYDHLGFQKTGDTGVYHLMEWMPRRICVDA